MHNKKIIIVGAGIIGLTTALKLAEEGYAVTVIEQNNKAAEGTSKANAGQLIYNFGAMGSPGFLRDLPKTLLHPELYGVIATGLCNPKNWPWAASFALQCTSKSWRENSLKLIKMAHQSREALDRFKQHHDIDFKWRKDGKIITHEHQKDLAGAEQIAAFQRMHGGKHRIITREECFEREPALNGTTRNIAGGTYIPDAEVGDCRLLCENLATILVTMYNAQINYNVKVKSLLRDQKRVIGIETSLGTLEADMFIICAGLNSNKLLPRNFPEKKPIIGVKGISLTYPLGECPPDLSIMDTAGKFVISRLGEKLRVTGYAIFSDNLNINQKHVSLLANKAKALMPSAAQYATAPEIWTGLRPQTPDDLPMIGNAGAENLYINAGHGSSGLILSFSSAEILSEKIKSHFIA